MEAKVSVLIQLMDDGKVNIQTSSNNRITTLGLLTAAQALVMSRPSDEPSNIVLPKMVK